jgi:hypothetical protein
LRAALAQQYTRRLLQLFFTWGQLQHSFAGIKASTKGDKGKGIHISAKRIPHNPVCKKVKDSTAHKDVNCTAPGAVGTAGNCKFVPASQLEVLNAGPLLLMLLTADNR